MSQRVQNISSPASSTDTITNDVHSLPLAHATSQHRLTISGHTPWITSLSTSFSTIAEQLQNASRAISEAAAQAPSPAHTAAPTPPEDDGNNDRRHRHDDVDHHHLPPHLATLATRLDMIEQAQERLAVEIAALRSMHAGKSRAGSDEIDEKTERTVVAVAKSSSGATLDDLEKRLEDTILTLKLDHDRLYARLHNSRVTVAKMPIMALPTATGKPPPNHPNTKGEFEHLTSLLFVLSLSEERYEALLKAYGQPIKGDTSEKREALRIFMGLTAR
ncbi:hypothetical protein B0F90DRAFT_1819790 [Multifurca ochricompacta]|uniref:Uncharacterized protein n=1 Tax=Multifurca ochricompacta TaxID=376703 RepID=A0AAD4QLL6_9AGAM|nr:hypothetical protein B0F90DRAFT_1819790 [Multifurca ochricompacta]